MSKKITRRQLLGIIGTGLSAGVASNYKIVHGEERNYTIAPENDPYNFDSIESLGARREIQRIIKICELRYRYSTPLEDINPKIRDQYLNGFIIDYLSIPEIQEANREPDISKRILKIIQILSVQSKEDALRLKNIYTKENFKEYFKNLKLKEQIDKMMQELITYKNGKLTITSLEMWKKYMGEKPIPDDPKSLSDLIFKLMNYGTSLDNKIADFVGKFTESNENLSVLTWSNQWSCNLYASAILCSLGLQHQISHRIDSKNRPVIAKEINGETKLFVEVDGKMVEPEGKIWELGAGSTREWLLRNKETHKGIDVTDFTYDQIMNLLNNGYIILGADNEHNWINFAIDGEPFLTQATYNTLLKAYVPRPFINQRNQDLPSFFNMGDMYSESYKIQPKSNIREASYVLSAKAVLFAFKIPEFKK